MKCPKCSHNLWNYKVRFDGTTSNICDKCKYDDYIEIKGK